MARQTAANGTTTYPDPGDDVAAAWWIANGMPAKIKDPAVLHAIVTLAFRQAEAPSPRRGRTVARAMPAAGAQQSASRETRREGSRADDPS
jgi:hypothetical protein